MKIKSLNLTNFRNYEDETIDLSGGLNILTGPNAQGKTNFIEAIYILSTLKSFRNSKLVDCIKEGKNEAKISAHIDSDAYGERLVEYTIFKEGENLFQLNGNKIKKRSEIFGNVTSIVFSPDELKIVKNAPDARREFLDTDISQVSKTYSELIDRCEVILLSRNKILKFNKYSEDLLLQLSVYDEQLAHVGGQIALSRENFVKKLSQRAEVVMDFLSCGKEKLTIEYIGAQGNTRIEKTDNIIKELKQSRQKDIELGYTNVGPHRDEIKFYINSVEVKPFASQGQQRSVVLALKIAEVEVFGEEKERPILLLDDVFSELDSKRQRQLLEYLKNNQVFVSATNTKIKPNFEFLHIKVKNGKTKAEYKNKQAF